jgi:hypothetical protein
MGKGSNKRGRAPKAKKKGIKSKVSSKQRTLTAKDWGEDEDEIIQTLVNADPPIISEESTPGEVAKQSKEFRERIMNKYPWRLVSNRLEKAWEEKITGKSTSYSCVSDHIQETCLIIICTVHGYTSSSQGRSARTRTMMATTIGMMMTRTTMIHQCNDFFLLP